MYACVRVRVCLSRALSLSLSLCMFVFSPYIYCMHTFSTISTLALSYKGTKFDYSSWYTGTKMDYRSWYIEGLWNRLSRPQK